MRIIQKLIVNSLKLKIGIILGLIALAGLLIYTRAEAQITRPLPQPTRFSYSAKFICGPQTQANIERQEPPVKLGNYATAVNIHNPQSSRTKIFKKVVIALPEPNQGKPTQKVEHILDPDGAMEVDCREINALLAKDGQISPGDNTFKKGFLVVESLAELDVVGVYTANTRVDITSTSQPSGMTMDVEYIPGRRIVGLQTSSFQPLPGEESGN